MESHEATMVGEGDPDWQSGPSSALASVTVGKFLLSCSVSSFVKRGNHFELSLVERVK